MRSLVAATVVFFLPMALAGHSVWHVGVPLWMKVLCPIGALYAWAIGFMIVAVTTMRPFELFDRVFSETTKTPL